MFRFRLDSVPGQEQDAQVSEDPLDILVGVPGDRWRGGASLRHQSHQPISVDVHTQFDCVSVQRQSETIAEDFHCPLYLHTNRSTPPYLTERVCVFTQAELTCLSVRSRLQALGFPSSSPRGFTTATATSLPTEGGKHLSTLTSALPAACDWSMAT